VQAHASGLRRLHQFQNEKGPVSETEAKERKKIQSQEKSERRRRRVFSESVEENPTEEDPILNRRDCIHSISPLAYDFKGLFDTVLKGINVDRHIFYFAKIKEHDSSKEKSQQLIEEQRRLKTHLEQQGFEVLLSGRVRGQMEEGQNGKKVLIFKEKGVDVKIAVDTVSLSCDNKVKAIILASSDSDLQPAVKEVRNRKVTCIYLGFEAQPNKGLSYTTNRTILMRKTEILEGVKAKLPFK